MGNSRVLIVSLILAIVVLVGGIMFLIGRLTAPQAQPQPPIVETQMQPVAPLPSPAAPPAAALVPAAFQAEWAANLKTCGAGIDADWMRLTPSEIRYYESGGKVTAVVVNSPLDIVVSADLSGEGETWSRSFHFVLSPDQSQLTDVSDKTGMIRQRCPAN